LEEFSINLEEISRERERVGESSREVWKRFRETIRKRIGKEQELGRKP
jgi:hypothetical protein